MTLETRLRAVLSAVLSEASHNPAFAAQLKKALGLEEVLRPVAGVRRSNRRNPAPFDPFVAYAAGEAELRRRLDDLSVDELKDMVAEHGMDSSKLALKWKSADRLIELIVTTVAARSRKGDAFRT